ncbi:uncharacterized protein LOC141641251 [Silene latifolia]|uniref:uncharacterized protein LOC141641251 n=1 Tax=Silene latifolia TaxID=37657 RepID=UPI003D78A888
MSDRQKGLIEAFNTVTPKAEIRFCVRHIWANFKQQYSGPVYKEAFWKAARATTIVEFKREMKGIKFLSPNAYAYLASIPAKHWSRHAFSTTSKNNSLLNNMCESFNAVLKEARDKPIITFMEWIRSGEYEVKHKGVQKAVNLEKRTCSCRHWELSGLPCSHAIVCIMDQREELLDYVDEAYTKATYVRAFEHAIAAMPGYQDWEKVGQVAPLPPPFKKLPGRPKMKKRRREASEESSGAAKKMTQRRACGKCGLLGHNVKTCKNPPMTHETEKLRTTRSKSTSAWSNKVRDGVARRAAKRRQDAKNGPRH